MLKPSNLTHSFTTLIRFLILVSLTAIQSGSAAPFAAAQNQDELVRGSRKAIIDTGFSAGYFDKHFKLIQVFNRPGDQRVVWQFSLNEYETRVTDSIGYSIPAGGKKIYAHSIADNLSATKDIPKTISRQRARTLMSSCIGNFENESIVLMKLDTGVSAALYLRANSWRKPKRESERERPAGSGAPAVASAPDRPAREEEGEQRPLKIGYINLETGKCTKANAMATP